MLTALLLFAGVVLGAAVACGIMFICYEHAGRYKY